MKSKMYTQGGEFTTADGSEYVGFYSVVDGVAYEGRDSIGQQLSQNDEFFTQLKVSDFYFNSIIDDVYILPHSLQDCQIPIGEFQIQNQINYRFENLLENLNYIGSKTVILNNVESQSVIGNLMLSSASIKIANDFIEQNVIALDPWMQNQTICEQSFTNDDKLIIFFVGQETDIYQRINYVLINISHGVYTVENTRNILNFAGDDTSPRFKNITQIKFVNNRLYIADQGNKQILLYDVSTLLSQEFSDQNLNRERLIKSIGGFGQTDDRNSFEYPQSIMVKNDGISIFDSSLKIVRDYDTNLNWLQTHRKNLTLADSNFITYSTLKNEYQSITDQGTFIRLTNECELIETKPLFVVPLSTETFLNIEISDNIQDLMYITSNLRTIAKYVSNDNQFIGYISYPQQLSGQTVYSQQVKNNSVSEDILISTKVLDTVQTVALTKYVPVYQTITQKSLFNLFSIDEIVIKDDYHQARVFVQLKKIMYNTLFLQNNMTRKIVFKTIDQEKIIKGMTYLSESERIQIEDKLNSDIGINEHVSPDTINRYIREIYKIQTEMIHALNVKNQDQYEQGVPILDDFQII